MTYLSDYADKTVAEIGPKISSSGASLPTFTEITFTDGDRLSVFIDGRSFYDRKGGEIRTSDFDAAFMDHYFSGPTIRTPQPPRWQTPQDRILRKLIEEYKLLSQTLMDLCGERHGGLNRDTYAARWQVAMERWRTFVLGLHGYNRYKPETHDRVPEEPKKTTLQRLMWWR